ncbi:MAG TPA: DUF4832 domain-containing protein [Puia sp.]|nr:DUF4832 domain-containing protein [Puia sp.]
MAFFTHIRLSLVLSLSLFAFRQRILAQNAPPVAGAQATIHYIASTADFPNPERGFYVPIGTSAGHFKPLDAESLKKLFAGPKKYGQAHYEVYSTLLMREYTLDSFREKPMSREFLDGIEHDLAAVREAGIKVILRFAYINKARTGDCPDEYKICPPYGDASKEIVLTHISQLKAIFEKYADIIAVLQEGFIGIWGENYYTDYFGDASNAGAGRIMDQGWQDRNEVLRALLAALPESRMIQVRTPQIKQKFIYGPHADTHSQAMTPDQAFTNSQLARIGFHNDCFLASPTDYGTYNDYGSSLSPRAEANETMRKYLQEDSRYVPVGGETCDDAYSPQNDCAPSGHAEEEMAAVHLSFLNTTYNNDVNNDWDSLGCMSSIRKRMGYRFRLEEANFPASATAGRSFTFKIRVRNEGYASPYNSRTAWLVLRERQSGREFTVPCRADVRRWFSGEVDFSETVPLPAVIPPGQYDLFLNLPDPYPSIAKTPEYSIRLANEDVWEKATGYNNLHYQLTITGLNAR